MIYIIYPGRFQPMGKHHLEVYNSLKVIFNTEEIYLATTNKTNLVDSPFSVEDKKYIMEKMGIPSSKVLSMIGKSPYDIEEVAKQIEIVNRKKLDKDNDILIFACGKKDADRFTSFTKKDGTPTRFQPYNEKKLLPFGIYAYIYMIPTVKIFVENQKEMSGSALREYLPECTRTEFKKIMGFYDLDIHEKLKQFKNERRG